MKKVALFAICMVFAPALAQTNSTHEQNLAAFRAAESQAPKGYPILFMIDNASGTPSNAFSNGQCSMDVETIGEIYSVGISGGWGGCKLFTPRSFVFGRVGRGPLGDMYVDLLDQDGGKTHNRRYFVTGTQLVDPSTQ
jgi:hypothetical protein